MKMNRFRSLLRHGTSVVACSLLISLTCNSRSEAQTTYGDDLPRTGEVIRRVLHRRLERNKEIVLQFYNAAFNKHDIEAAIRYLGPVYIQHNPTVPDGVAGFRQAIGAFLSAYPQLSAQIVRIFAEENYVILHVHARFYPSDRGSAVMDIFRLDDDGKIVEHWDVVQAVPASSANNNTMF